MTKKALAACTILVVLTGCGSGSNSAPSTTAQITEFRGHRPTPEELAKVKSLGPANGPMAADPNSGTGAMKPTAPPANN